MNWCCEIKSEIWDLLPPNHILDPSNLDHTTTCSTDFCTETQSTDQRDLFSFFPEWKLVGMPKNGEFFKVLKVDILLWFLQRCPGGPTSSWSSQLEGITFYTINYRSYTSISQLKHLRKPPPPPYMYINILIYPSTPKFYMNINEYKYSI